MVLNYCLVIDSMRIKIDSIWLDGMGLGVRASLKIPVEVVSSPRKGTASSSVVKEIPFASRHFTSTRLPLPPPSSKRRRRSGRIKDVRQDTNSA